MQLNLLILLCSLQSAISFSSVPASVLLRPSGSSQSSTCSVLQSSWADVAAEGLVTTTVRSVEVIGKTFSSIFAQFASLNGAQKLLMCLVFLLGFGVGRMQPFWKRYESVHDVPQKYIGSKKILRGRAVRISDGDTIRFLHTPVFWSKKALQKGERSSKVALPIRLCTIDTPETAKFGKPGQPFGVDAKQKLRELLENKKVRVRLLSLDQYGRGVAQVFTRPWLRRRHVDETMLKCGLAEVYEGSGAKYGPKGLSYYLALQEAARQQKLGIWSLKKRESAAEYKKRTK